MIRVDIEQLIAQTDKFSYVIMADIMDLIDEYKSLIIQYRRKMQELRKAERKHEDFSILHFIDKERNEIHNKLRELAPKLDKSASDITVDILESDKDLSEYQIPEFKIVRTTNTFDRISWICVNENGKHGPWNREVENTIKSATVFIPFGQQEFYHLFDAMGSPMREADELERRRRLEKLVKILPVESFNVDIYSSETYHRGTLLYGLAFHPHDIDRVLAIMREHKAEISIDHSYFNAEQIEEDVISMAEEDVAYIKIEGPGEQETIPGLLKNLANAWNYSFKFPGNTKKIVNDLFDLEIHEAEKEYDRQELEKEIEARLGKVSDDFPRESSMPKIEPMKRRLF